MSIFEYISYSEFVKLVVCLTIDLVEYVIPFLLTPFVGDLFDVIGVVSCFYMFRLFGLFALLELVPGLDALPINVLTWLLWVLSKRWDKIMGAMHWEP